MEPFTPRAGDQLGTEQGESSNSQQQETQQTTTISFEGQQNNEEREILPTSGLGSPVSAHNESEQDALDRELQELEAWREKTAKRQRVAHQRRDITQSRPECADSEVTNSKGASYVCKAHSFGIQLLDA